MAAPKLEPEQQEALLEWLAADYSTTLILKWFQEREWPEITRYAVAYYRKRFQKTVAKLRAERREAALKRGLALKAERVARLTEHADELEAIKWQPDEKGRLWNEKAWRETLDDIAAEMGERQKSVKVTGDPDEPVIVKVLRGVSMDDL